jgi:class 3 adenylate cyclase
VLDLLKGYLVRNFEQSFVLLILIVTVVVNYYVPQKVAFLNFYFLPIILGAYYLGQKRAMLGAVFCVVMLTGYAMHDPDAFVSPGSPREIYLYLTIWGSFLILAGAVVGRLQEHLKEEVGVARQLNQQLDLKRHELDESNRQLLDTNQNLEARVEERTQELRQSKAAIEGLKTKVEGALYSTMDSAVVNLMIEGRLRSEKRQMAVMFVDLVGFTTYSESSPPENVVADVNRYLQDMEPIMLSYHAHIDKYMGDGIMCEFGAPIEYAMHRLMAVACAVKMQRVLAERKHPWQMRVGIASGNAIVGLVGSRRQTYTAIGDIVNLAARLERGCAPGRVLIDRRTFEEIHPYFETRRIRNLYLRESDRAKEQELNALLEELPARKGDADLLHRIGKLHLQMQELPEAMECFETALGLDPANDAFKISYAEAGLKLKESEKISVKGKFQRVEAFEVSGMKDPLLNTDKIPAALYERYRTVVDEMNVPEDVTLPSEVVDGSIGHSRVVAFLSYALADALGLSNSEKQDILRAGLLADIGKELISPDLRNRRGGLSLTELETVKQHPDESCRLMRKMGYDNPAVLNLVRHSHEHFANEGGYPRELRGEDIPFGSRIIAVADTYDAMTSWRPYSQPWERHAALGEINREVEKGRFDPAVVGKLSQLVV